MRSLIVLGAFVVVMAGSGGAEDRGAPPGNIPPLYRDEWWTDSDYAYGYGYDFYDVNGDYGYVAPGVPKWDAEWLPAASYQYANWQELSRWFRAGSYLTYAETVVIAARRETIAAGQNRVPATGETVSVRGRIAGVGADIVGKLQKDHLLIGLRTAHGPTIVADLGPGVRTLQQMGVAEGREAAVTGVLERVADPVLIRTESLEVGGRTLVVRAPRRVVLVGQVADTLRLEVKGANETHLAVLLETGQGELAVNLGPVKAAALRKGRPLVVEGRLTAIGNNAFLTAHRFQAGI